MLFNVLIDLSLTLSFLQAGLFLSTKHVLLWQILNAMTQFAEIWAQEPQNNSKNNGTNFARGHMGQIKVQ